MLFLKVILIFLIVFRVDLVFSLSLLQEEIKPSNVFLLKEQAEASNNFYMFHIFKREDKERKEAEFFEVLFTDADFERKGKCDGICLYFLVYRRGQFMENQHVLDVVYRVRKYVLKSDKLINDFGVFKLGERDFMIILLNGANELEFYRLSVSVGDRRFDVSLRRERVFSLKDVLDLSGYDACVFSLLVPYSFGKDYKFLVKSECGRKQDKTCHVFEYDIRNRALKFVTRFDILFKYDILGRNVFFFGDNALFVLENEERPDMIFLRTLKNGCKFEFNATNVIPFKYNRGSLFFYTKTFDQQAQFSWYESHDCHFYRYLFSAEFDKKLTFCPRIDFIRRLLYGDRRGLGFLGSIDVYTLNYDKCSLSYDFKFVDDDMKVFKLLFMVTRDLDIVNIPFFSGSKFFAIKKLSDIDRNYSEFRFIYFSE